MILTTTYDQRGKFRTCKIGESFSIVSKKLNISILKILLRIKDIFCDPVSVLLGIQVESGNWVELHLVESV